MFVSAVPKYLASATATTITQSRVRLSGSLKLICACPLASVWTAGAKVANGLKLLRTEIGVWA